MRNLENQRRMEQWSFQSPEAPGFHNVIVPGRDDCRAIYIYRLNLPKGESHPLQAGELELHPVLMEGAASLSGSSGPGASLLDNIEMKRFDSFYLRGETSVLITALEDAVFYIAGAKYEGIGEVSFRSYNPDLPIGDLHQIHGSGVGRREVMFTLAPITPASNLICGLTWGGDGAWTSWPPHQHEAHLEEAYCYFDMPAPKFGLHLSYLKSGECEDLVAHPVSSGTMILAPCGYHPTVASPVTRNAYFWALASFTPASRSYDLAVLDPAYVEEPHE